MDLSKTAIKAALGIETDAELARFFNIGRWAVGQWADDQPIPERRQWELRARRPDLFGGGKPRRKGRADAPAGEAA